MMYRVLVVGQLAANCYLVWDKKTLETVIIDPGDDYDYIANEIKRLGLKPVKILATHGHFDHVLAVNELKLAYGVQFLIHQQDAPILLRARRMCQYFCNFDPGPGPEADGFIKENDLVRFGSEALRVIETPGHTPGGICFYGEKDHVFFCGDTIFAHGCWGRTDLKEGDQTLLMNSIKNKIFVLPGKIKLLSGHGEASTIEKERIQMSF